MAESKKALTKHDVSEMKQTYANVTMLQATPVDIGIGFGLTEFESSQKMMAKYHTMIRLSFEQARKLNAHLSKLLTELESSTATDDEHD